MAATRLPSSVPSLTSRPSSDIQLRIISTVSEVASSKQSKADLELEYGVYAEGFRTVACADRWTVGRNAFDHDDDRPSVNRGAPKCQEQQKQLFDRECGRLRARIQNTEAEAKAGSDTKRRALRTFDFVDRTGMI